MKMIDRLQRQLEIHRRNQSRTFEAPESDGAHTLSLCPETELGEEGTRADSFAPFGGEASQGVGERDNRISSQLQMENRQAILHQLERLRRLQEGRSRNFRGQVSDRQLHSDFGGEIRMTTAGSFLYLTELYERSGIQLNGDDPESDRQLVLSLVQLLSGKQIECEPSRIAFLDTETTGLSGGAGAYAFLVGIGTWCSSGFIVEQFFMRNFDEEGAVICSLEERLSQVKVVVTFNGKCFDLPLLESRFIMHRRDWPLVDGIHLDLLHPSRRLWKLRLKDCSLANLERQVLGFERAEDVAGYLIPQLYFNYVRAGASTGLKAIFRHNRQDIRTLAELTRIVAGILVGCSSREELAVEDLFGAARYLASLGRRQQSLQFSEEVLERGGLESMKVEALRQLASIHESQKTYYRAAALWQKMMTTSPFFQAEACEKLAIHHEHRTGDLVKALELVEDAIRRVQIERNVQKSSRSGRLHQWLHRRARLQRKISRSSNYAQT
jgi:uncharacterized protein YprB with RNaseH-like and TPR domain